MTIVNRASRHQASQALSSQTLSSQASITPASALQGMTLPFKKRWMSTLGFQGNPLPHRTEGKTLRKTSRPLTDPPLAALPTPPQPYLPSRQNKWDRASRSRRLRWESKLPSLITEALLPVFNHYWQGRVVPAVFHDRQFYLLKASYGDHDRLQAFSDAMELMQVGSVTLVTKVPSGYRLWMGL
jgi:hypothetical protein